MKKLLLRLLLSVLLAGAALWVWRAWVQSGTAPHTVLYLYGSSSVSLQQDPLLAALRENGLDAAAVQTSDVLAAAEEASRGGTSVLILELEQAPSDMGLLKTAAAHDTQLFFVGAYPGSSYLDSYDAAYFIGSRDAFAGELAGDAVAMAYREGTLADADGNLLLDYLSAADESPAQAARQESLLTECEHYGVYTESALSALQEQTQAEDAQSVTADSPAATAVPAELSLSTRWADLAYDPDVLLCYSQEQFAEAKAAAQAAGWLDRASPIYFAATAASREQAVQMQADGCNIVVYYDVQAVTDTVTQMVLNFSRQDYIAQGAAYSPDEHRALWLPYRLLESGAANAGASSSSASASASGAAGSAEQ